MATLESVRLKVFGKRALADLLSPRDPAQRCLEGTIFGTMATCLKATPFYEDTQTKTGGK